MTIIFRKQTQKFHFHSHESCSGGSIILLTHLHLNNSLFKNKVFILLVTIDDGMKDKEDLNTEPPQYSQKNSHTLSIHQLIQLKYSHS